MLFPSLPLFASCCLHRPPLGSVTLSLFRVGGFTFSSFIFSLEWVLFLIVLMGGVFSLSLFLGGVVSPRSLEWCCCHLLLVVVLLILWGGGAFTPSLLLGCVAGPPLLLVRCCLPSSFFVMGGVLSSSSFGWCCFVNRPLARHGD